MDRKRLRERKEALRVILVTVAGFVDPDKGNFDACVHYGAMATQTKKKWFGWLLKRYLDQTSAEGSR